MKKATMNTILTLIANDTSAEAEAVRAELTAELGKGEAVKAENAKVYDAAKAVVFAELGETPVTISELYDALESELPEGFSKGKLQYAMTRLWKDDLKKVEGKVNAYCKA